MPSTQKDKVCEDKINGDDTTKSSKVPPAPKRRRVLKPKKHPAAPSTVKGKEQKKDKGTLPENLFKNPFSNLSLTNFFQKAKPVNTSVSIDFNENKCQAIWFRKSDCFL